ncbi:MAG: CHAT domain-containing protein [Nitrospirae bacterium]|nr:CHAT domain-containing protein [Nitrospirota bacterium]MCL5978499.1 CHAT domain-containing protein [Nitrospirota bacterium]
MEKGKTIGILAIVALSLFLIFSFSAFGQEQSLDEAKRLNRKVVELYKQGKYNEAINYAQQVLAIREKALGSEHPDVATSLSNLAGQYESTGRYAEAEPLYKRELEIREKVFGREHPETAIVLRMLAELYRVTGRYAEAEPLYKRSLEIVEKAFGKDHFSVAASLSKLAMLYYSTGRYAEAEPLYTRALAIQEKTLGREHPAVAHILSPLAELYRATGRYGEAEPLYKRALAIWEKALGSEHPAVALRLNHLAFLYAATERHPESQNLFKRSISMDDLKRENVFLVLNEKQKISYMNQNEGSIHAFMSHSVKHMQSSPQAITDTFNAWLKWKGAVAEAQGRYMDAAMQSGDPEVKRKLDELTAIRREIAKMQLSKPDRDGFEAYRNRIDALQKQKETLEAELSRLSKDFALEKTIGRADVNNISEILPKDSVYIDFAKIEFYDFKKNKLDKPKYLAFVLIPQKEPQVKLIEISDAGDIEKHVKAYLQEMNKIKTSGNVPDKTALDTAARAIYDLAIKPLEKYIKGRKQLFISPDGNLNLIPFEALVTPSNKYLMEEYTISYISAGRDIIRFTDTNIAKGDALIIADPDYDMGLMERDKMTKEMKVAKTIRGGLSKDVLNISFDRLPDTKQEADAIEKVLKNKKKLKVKNYQNIKAIEEMIFSAETPKILHLATHGYFLNDEELKVSSETRGVKIKLKDDFMAKDEAVNIENPMLRSGIVFSGVNASLKAGRDDGMMSAEKILGVNLKGTDLVVLSACETGVGDVQNGEGVFGLKRAFILSGAKTLVMSLWSVPSAETTELMTDFYTLMSTGKPKAEALRQAKLNMMKKKSNPFYWGAFVMTGKPE